MQNVLNPRMAWLGYALFYLFLSMKKNLLDSGINHSILVLLMNSIVPIAVAYAIYGYVFGKAFMERTIWRVVFFILCVRLIFDVLNGISEFRQIQEYILAQGESMEVTGINVTYYMLMLLIPLPGLYVLYRYSEMDNPVWIEREHLEHHKFALQLFDTKDVVTGSLTREEGEGISCEARLTRRDGKFDLQMSITEQGQTREEKHQFDSAIQALEYIEENTPLSMYELE